MRRSTEGAGRGCVCLNLFSSADDDYMHTIISEGLPLNEALIGVGAGEGP